MLRSECERTEDERARVKERTESEIAQGRMVQTEKEGRERICSKRER